MCWKVNLWSQVNLPDCSDLLEGYDGSTGVLLLTTQEIRDKAWRCRLPWKVRTPHEANIRLWTFYQQPLENVFVLHFMVFKPVLTIKILLLKV